MANTPRRSWEIHLNDSDSAWAKKLKPKYAFSGFAKNIIKHLSWEDIQILFNPENNVIVVNGKKISERDSLSRCQAFDRVTAGFNPPAPYIDDEGNLIDLGGHHIPGYLYMTIEDGEEVWKLVRKEIKFDRRRVKAYEEN